MSPGIPTRLLATQSDERLLALVRQGHERAFEAVVHRYRKVLLGYCRRLRLSDARAEDIVQLALLKTWIAVREGAEVRDLKAWLYRVVHNTAVNALRDSAHDGEPLADPTLGSRFHPRTDDSQLDQGLTMREALAEVAALPPLQREVIVRTAVAGHSHEQVASDLGITNGAVRGLLYRARATLRTGITALTPPPLLSWLAGRPDQGAPAPERLAELAGGAGAGSVGGAAGVGGLLLKGGVAAITAGTMITGATVVHLSVSAPHRDHHRLIAAAAPTSGAGASTTTAAAHPAARYGEFSTTSARPHRGASGRHAGHRAGLAGGKARAKINAAGGGSVGAPTTSGGHHAPRPTTRATGNGRNNAAAKAPAVQSPAPSSTQGSGQAGAGPSQSGGSGQGGESSAGSGGPVGSAAGSGSPGGSDASGSSSEGGTSGGGHLGSGSGVGVGSSGSGGSEGTSSGGSSGSTSGSSGSESSGGEQSGSLVGTAVHEVGGVLEHLLH